MNIDERMKMLMENMKRLSSKHPQFTCGKFPPEWDKPLTEKEVAEYEKKNNILPVPLTTSLSLEEKDQTVSTQICSSHHPLPSVSSSCVPVFFSTPFLPYTAFPSLLSSSSCLFLWFSVNSF